MIPFHISTIVPILHAKWIGPDCIISTVVIDSRMIMPKNNSLFIALKGEKFDAHIFVEQAIFSGAVAILVNYPMSFDISQLIVSDTYQAFKTLSKWIRKKSSARIVAITGSSGKTSVKEMTTSILQQCGHVLSTDKNFNNYIGVPLTLLRLTSQHNFAVIEIGASHSGEIYQMTNLVCPDSALVNNIFASHLSGFGSLSNLSKAKSEIFYGLSTDGIGIINYDSHDWLHWKYILQEKLVYRFSLFPCNDVDFFASHIVCNTIGVSFILHTPQGICPINLPLLGKHNVSNAIAASALSLSVGADLSSISIGLKNIKKIPGRIFPIKLGIHKWLLDDSYNANVGSVEAAIQVLMYMPGYKIIVIGDMLELGDATIQYHKYIGQIISHTKINKVLSIGQFSLFITQISNKGEHFENKNQLIDRLQKLLLEKTAITILVKGSRSTNMETIIQELQQRNSLC